jgi:hypothetical protein
MNLYNFSNLEVIWYCVLICVWMCFKNIFDMKKYQINTFWVFFDNFDVKNKKKFKIFLIHFQVKNILHHNTTHTHLINLLKITVKVHLKK